MVKIMYIGVISPQILTTAVNFFIYDLKDESYYLTCPVMYVFCVTIFTMNEFFFMWLLYIHLRLPFNWHTPFGYAIALFAQFTAAFAVLYATSTILCFLVGSCWLFIVIIRDITSDLLESNRIEMYKSSNQDLKMRFRSIVEFYLDGKQMMDEFNGIYELIITNGFFWARLGKKIEICALKQKVYLIFCD